MFNRAYKTARGDKFARVNKIERRYFFTRFFFSVFFFISLCFFFESLANQSSCNFLHSCNFFIVKFSIFVNFCLRAILIRFFSETSVLLVILNFSGFKHGVVNLKTKISQVSTISQVRILALSSKWLNSERVNIIPF